jgi:hypothetical protein
MTINDIVEFPVRHGAGFLFMAVFVEQMGGRGTLASGDGSFG